MDVHPIKNGIFIAIDPYLNEVDVSGPMCLVRQGCRRGMVAQQVCAMLADRSGVVATRLV